MNLEETFVKNNKRIAEINNEIDSMRKASDILNNNINKLKEEEDLIRYINRKAMFDGLYPVGIVSHRRNNFQIRLDDSSPFFPYRVDADNPMYTKESSEYKFYGKWKKVESDPEYYKRIE